MLNAIEHHPKFDMMRGVAALVVLFGHAFQIYIKRLRRDDDILSTIAGALPFHAVLVFFLLSGYLITVSMIANVHRNRRFDIVDYLSARVARIYPPLLGAILLVVCCWAVINALDLPGATAYGIGTDTYVVRTRFNFRPLDVVFALAMHNGMLEADGPLWSLYIEFIVYIVAMFLAVAVTTKSFARRAGAVVAAIVLFVYGTSVNAEFPFFALIWLAGAVTALAIAAGIREKLASSGRAPAAAAIAFLVILGIFNPGLLLSQSGSILADGVLGVFCLCYLYAMFISTIFDGAKSKPLIASGAYSYSLYIVHFPLLLLAYSFTQKWMGSSLPRTLTVATLAMTIAVMVASRFAKYLENQRLFKPWIRAAFLKIT